MHDAFLLREPSRCVQAGMDLAAEGDKTESGESQNDSVQPLA